MIGAGLSLAEQLRTRTALREAAISSSCIVWGAAYGRVCFTVYGKAGT